QFEHAVLVAEGDEGLARGVGEVEVVGGRLGALGRQQRPATAVVERRDGRQPTRTRLGVRAALDVGLSGGGRQRRDGDVRGERRLVGRARPDGDRWAPFGGGGSGIVHRREGREV